MSFIEDGFCLVSSFISTTWLNTLLENISQSSTLSLVTGIRRAEQKFSSVQPYLQSAEFAHSAAPYLDEKHCLVRAILFNKTPEANWFVTWHQDKTVAVSQSFECPGWTAWSRKEGCLHVQPPQAVLDSMVTIRIHLDAAIRSNGCLKVVPRSHLQGVLPSANVAAHVNENDVVYCEAKPGDALIMRPHLIHASEKLIHASEKNHASEEKAQPNLRRVLHLEFSNWTLPQGVSWA